MRGLLMGLHARLIPIDLDEYETIRVVNLFNHVESQITRFLRRCFGISREA